MISMSTVIDGLATWPKPPDVHGTIRLGGRMPSHLPPRVVEPIRMQLRLAGHPWGQVNLTFDRTMSVAAVHDRLDEAVADLRRGVRFMAGVYAGARGGRSA